MTMGPYWQGLSLGASLIMAIGAQNAHVLRTGLQRRHVALTVAACIAIDIVLIGLGVAGMGAAVNDNAVLLAAVRWGGAAFLLCYGLRSLRAALRGDSFELAASAKAGSRRHAMLSVAALSLLNPHVYIDTVVLLGGIGSRLPGLQRPWFTAGAATASVLWFCAIGFGARQLAPLFNRRAVWRCVDLLTACMMLALSALLVADA
jgi:L-lysine exporter family protein LysE/ArgO